MKSFEWLGLVPPNCSELLRSTPNQSEPLKLFFNMKTFYVNLTISILLIVGGFFVPPIGVIDGSVLQAVGLLVMFSVIEKIPEAIKAGKSIRLQKGDLSITAGHESTEASSE